MICVGDKLMFNTKAMNDMYGHGEPVEVVKMVRSSLDGSQIPSVRVWEPFLYFGQKARQIEMAFHPSYFLTINQQIPKPTWIEKICDRIFS